MLPSRAGPRPSLWTTDFRTSGNPQQVLMSKRLRLRRRRLRNRRELIVVPLDQTALLIELEPVVATNLDRHLSLAKEWFPHEYVPWSEGRTYDGLLGGEAWQVTDSKLPDVARTALIINLL